MPCNPNQHDHCAGLGVKRSRRVAVAISKRVPIPSLEDIFSDHSRAVVTVTLEAVKEGEAPSVEFWELSVNLRHRKSSFRPLSRDEAFSRFERIARAEDRSIVIE
jgi:hypothetical protein